jgi:addiction module HigA family antidote
MEHKKISIIGNILFNEAIPSTGMRNCDFAAKLGISRTHLYDICRGDRRLTWKVAKRLGEITDKPAREWLAMQADQDLAEPRHA